MLDIIIFEEGAQISTLYLAGTYKTIGHNPRPFSGGTYQNNARFVVLETCERLIKIPLERERAREFNASRMNAWSALGKRWGDKFGFSQKQEVTLVGAKFSVSMREERGDNYSLSIRQAKITRPPLISEPLLTPFDVQKILEDWQSLGGEPKFGYDEVYVAVTLLLNS